MNVATVLDLIQKGIQAAALLIEAGRSAQPALEAIAGLASGAANEELSQEDMDQTSALLDRLIAEFNEPLGDAGDAAS